MPCLIVFILHHIERHQSHRISIFVFFVTLIGVLGGSDVTGGSSKALRVTVGVPMTVLRRVMGLSDSLHYCFEASVRSRSILHHPGRTIGFFQSITSGDQVTLSLFMLGLDVVGVGIVHSIFEGVVGLVLKKKIHFYNKRSRREQGYLHNLQKRPK